MSTRVELRNRRFLYCLVSLLRILNISGASDGKYSLGGMLVENQIPGPPKQLTVSQWQSNIGGELKKILDRAHGKCNLYVSPFIEETDVRNV